MTFVIDEQRMREIMQSPPRIPTDSDLSRNGQAFFVGGTLPINATLETMFESYCAESTDIFVVTFGAAESVRHGLEMVKQIKNNFNIRLMVRLNQPVSARLYPQIYASGADLIDITATTLTAENDFCFDDDQKDLYLAAKHAFPRWSAASTFAIDGNARSDLISMIDTLLHIGVVPLPRLTQQSGTDVPEAEIREVLHHLATSWHRHGVAIKPLCSLIRLASPLVPAERPGVLRSIIGRLNDNGKLAASDLLRHLRVSAATDSLDSAEL